MKLSHILSLACTVLLLSGCIPHTTGKTEVGVRTKKIALWGEKGRREQSLCSWFNQFFSADNQ